jgi:hypothetical protein
MEMRALLPHINMSRKYLLLLLFVLIGRYVLVLSGIHRGQGIQTAVPLRRLLCQRTFVHSARLTDHWNLFQVSGSICST